MTASRDPDRLIHAFLLEGAERLPDQVYDAVRAGIEQKRQRAVIGPWRMPTLNKLVPIGLGIAAVVAVLVVGSRLFGPPTSGVGGPSVEPSPTPQASVAEPTPEPTRSSSAWAGLPEGPFVIGDDEAVQVTVNIASPGWSSMPEIDAVSKNDDRLDPPETVGVALLAWAYTAGINVYGDPCDWSTTTPETPATTVDEIAADLAAQASRDATTPVDVTVGGSAGKHLTLHVPNDAPDAETAFADCDGGRFASYGVEGESEPARTHQGPGQVDELWILDVDGAVVILDALYGPAAPADLVDELRSLAESATFETP